MRDDRTLLRWLDLSLFAPLPLSVCVAIWAIMTRPDPGILTTLLLVQAALVAGACSAPASLAARDSLIWRARVAPSGFVRSVHRAWREHAMLLLALGLIGPAIAAVRALEMDALALACWSLALPIWGAALGTLAAWAWQGSLPPAALAVGPVLVGAAIAMGMLPATWRDATGPAAATLATGLLALAWVWRAAHGLHARWAGVGPLLARRRRAPGMHRWRWDTLAFDDQGATGAGGSQAMWSQFMLFLVVSFSLNSVTPALLADRIAGRDALHFGIYAGYLMVYATLNLVLRVSHWRLKLAPGSERPDAQVARMLLESTLCLSATAVGVLGFHAWRQGLGLGALALPATRAVLDAAFCVGLAAWLRGLRNRSLEAMVVVFGLLGLLGGGLWLLHARGLGVPRSAGVLALQALTAATFMGLARRAWRHRVPRGAQTGLAGATR